MDLEHGVLEFEGGLRLHPQYTLADFKKTDYYMNQTDYSMDRDDIWTASLGKQSMVDRDFLVTLLFQEEKLHLVSLIACDVDCDREFSHEGVLARKRLHDSILFNHGIVESKEFPWGRVSSDYDDWKDLSTITLVYEPQIVLSTDAKERNRILKRFYKAQPGRELRIIWGTFLCMLGEVALGFTVCMAIDHPMNGDGVYVWSLVGLVLVSISLIPGVISFLKTWYEYGLPYSSYANGTLSIVGDTLEYSFWKVGVRNPAAYGWKRATYSDYFRKVYTIERSDIKEIQLRNGICTIKGWGVIQSSPDANEEEKLCRDFSFLWAFPQEDGYQKVEKWFRQPSKKPRKPQAQHQGTQNTCQSLGDFLSFWDYWNGTNGGYFAMPERLVDWHYVFPISIDQLPTFTDLGQRFYVVDRLSWTLLRNQEETAQEFSAIPEREMERNLIFVGKHKDFFLGITKDFLDDRGNLHLLPRFAMPYLFYRMEGKVQRVHLERARCSLCGWRGRIANPDAAVIYIGSSGHSENGREVECCPRCKTHLEQPAIWLEPTE